MFTREQFEQESRSFEAEWAAANARIAEMRANIEQAFRDFESLNNIFDRDDAIDVEFEVVTSSRAAIDGRKAIGQ